MLYKYQEEKEKDKMNKNLLQQAIQEVKKFKESYVPTTFKELAALHPVCDEYDESTIIILEEKGMQKNIGEYHKILNKYNLTYYSHISVLEKETTFEVIQKIITCAKNGFILGNIVAQQYSDFKHNDITGRCFDYLFKKMVYNPENPIDIVINNSNQDYELGELIEMTFTLAESNVISSSMMFSNEIINQILQYREQFIEAFEIACEELEEAY